MLFIPDISDYVVCSGYLWLCCVLRISRGYSVRFGYPRFLCVLRIPGYVCVLRISPYALLLQGVPINRAVFLVTFLLGSPCLTNSIEHVLSARLLRLI